MRRVAPAERHIPCRASHSEAATVTLGGQQTAATVNGQFARVNWTRRRQVAGIKMERVDVDHSSIKLGIRLQKLSQRLRGDIPATGDRDVRVPGTKLRFDPDGERGLLHALVNLE